MSEGGRLYKRPLGSGQSDTEEAVEEACGACAAAALDTVWLRWGPPSDAAEAFTAGMGCGAGGGRAPIVVVKQTDGHAHAKIDGKGGGDAHQQLHE